MPLTLAQDWKTDNTGAGTGNLTVSWNSSVTSGSLLILIVACDTTVTTPTNWSFYTGSPTGSVKHYFFWRISTGGADDSPTLSTGARTCIAYAEYLGNRPFPSEVAVGTDGGVGSTAQTTGTTTSTQQADELAIATWSSSRTGTGVTYSGETNGFTEVAEVITSASGVNIGLTVATLPLTSAQTVESSATPAASCARVGLLGTFKASDPPFGYAFGSFDWLAADGIGATYQVFGLPFAPKAFRLSFNGLPASTTSSQTLNGRRCIGLATGTAGTVTRRAASSFDQDGALTMACASVVRNDCILCGVNATPATAGRLDVQTFDDGGATFIVDDPAPVNFHVIWEAWGGTDITVASVGDIAEPAATGDQNYTVTGFTSGATDQVVMFVGVQSTAAVNSAQAESSGFTVGYAAGTGAADNIMVTGAQDHGSAVADTDGWGGSGHCLGQVALAGGNLTSDAALSAWVTDAYTLTWGSRTTTNRRSIFLAIKGGQWKVVEQTIEGQTANATSTVSGLVFQPVGACFIGRMTAENTGVTTGTQDCMTWGMATGTANRQAFGYLSEDATASSASEVNLTVSVTQALSYPSTSGTEQSAYDINAWNSDGWQLIVDTAGGVTGEWIGSLTFGANAQSLSRTATESVSSSESVTRVLSAPRTASESPTISESAARILSLFRTATESVSSSESVVAIAPKIRTATDAISSSETVTRVSVKQVSTVDSGTTSDAVTRTASLTRNITEAPHSSESAATLATKSRTTTDAVSSADVVTRAEVLGRSLTDAVSSSESVTATSLKPRTATDAPHSSDAASQTKTAVRTALEQGIASDTVTNFKTSVRTTTDAPHSSESVVRTVSEVRTTTDAPHSTDAVTRTGTFGRAGTDAVSSSESANAQKGLTVRSATDAVSSADVATRIGVFGRTDTDVVSSSEIATGIATKARNVTDAASVADAVTRTVGQGRTATDAPHSSDVAVRAYTPSRTASDSLSALDTAVVVKVLNRLSSEAVASADAVVASSLKSRTANDAPHSTDTATQLKTRIVSATDALFTSDAATRAFLGTRNALDSLQALDLATATKLSPTDFVRLFFLYGIDGTTKGLRGIDGTTKRLESIDSTTKRSKGIDSTTKTATGTDTTTQRVKGRAP